MMFADHVKLQILTSLFSIVPGGTDGSLEREPHTEVRGYFHLSLRDLPCPRPIAVSPRPAIAVSWLKPPRLPRCLAIGYRLLAIHHESLRRVPLTAPSR
jgi:hypothetical protein